MNEIEEKIVNDESSVCLNRQIIEGLFNLGWKAARCPDCCKIYYEKPGRGIRSCQTEACVGVAVPRSEVESVKIVTVKEIGERIQKYYLDRGYLRSYPMGVVNRGNVWGNTSLIVSGVQRLTPYFLNNAWVPPSLFINQPCVRTQFREMSTGDNWSSSTFINSSVLNSDCSISEHLSAVGCWLDCLDCVGVDTDNITLGTRTEREQWGQCSFTVDIIDIYYFGLHIADAGYSCDLSRGNNKVCFSDIGTGLERITGIVNSGCFNEVQTSRDTLGKLLDPVFADTIKAITLIVGSGATPSDVDAWQHVKGYLSLVSKRKFSLDCIEEAVSYYLKYWEPFVGDTEFLDRKCTIVDLMSNRMNGN